MYVMKFNRYNVTKISMCFFVSVNRKHSPRMQDVSALFEMVSIHNCCDTQCTELDLTAMCYND